MHGKYNSAREIWVGLRVSVLDYWVHSMTWSRSIGNGSNIQIKLCIFSGNNIVLSHVFRGMMGMIFDNVSLSSRKVLRKMAMWHYIYAGLRSLSRDLNPCRYQSHLLAESCQSPAISRFQYQSYGRLSFNRGCIQYISISTPI